MTVEVSRDGAPRIVTLCGSMRFHRQLMQVAAEETAAGRIVLAPFVVVAPREQDTCGGAARRAWPCGQIDMADEVVIVSDGSNYMGDSTRAELDYAHGLGKPIRRERRP